MDHSPEIILALATLGFWCATRQLVVGADKTAKRQLRAYLCVTHVARVKATKPDGYAFEIKFLNSGQTPAYAIKTWRGIGVDNFPLAAKLPAPPTPTPATDVALGNGAIHTFTCERVIPFTQTENDLIRAGKAAIYFWGRIEYLDVFKESHFTNFCLSYRKPDGLIHSEIGNDAD